MMSFSEFSCIQPYLVNNLITFMECLSIDILRFIIINFVHIWIFVGINYFISQLFIIIKEFITSDIKFLFIKNIFLWIELRSFWRSYTVVKFFIRNVAYSRDQNFSCSIVFHCDCYIRFHCVVCNGCVCSSYFFNSVVVYAFLVFLELKFRELNIT